ncbi:MAG: energy transducer TonB [Bacteroidota bacterium]
MFVLISTGLFAQKSEGATAASEVFTIVEEMPEPPGGMAAFYKYLSANIVYPQKEKEAGISGKSFIKFVVGTDGDLYDIQVLKGVPDCKACDNEAVRVIKSYPEKWKPGHQNGKAVKVYYTLPVSFKAPVNETNPQTK